MFRLKKIDVWASEIAEYLNRELIGEDFLVKSPRCIKTLGSLMRLQADAQFKGEKTLLISEQEIPDSGCAGCIISNTPELDLAHVLLEFFATTPVNKIHPSAVISEETNIGRNVMIGANSVIGPDVEVGNNTKIFSNVVINGPAVIGKFCVIKDGAIVGSEGWAFVEDEDGNPFHAPQLGRIFIEDRSWVGSNSTIERAMVEDTVISAYVKVDDLVHVGAGSIIGKRSMLTAGSIVAYNVVIGENVKIAPNAVIRENVQISDNVVVGQGAVVISNLAADKVYVGNPARVLRRNVEQEGGLL